MQQIKWVKEVKVFPEEKLLSRVPPFMVKTEEKCMESALADLFRKKFTRWGTQCNYTVG
jgi:hypothetical protein